MDEHKNEDIVCRRLINRIKENYNINIIATDKHWSYNKIINCRKREIHKTIYNKKKKEIIKKEYSINKEEEYLDCNFHIMSKSETCLVEAYNSSLRDTFAKFRRKTKSISRSIKSIFYTMILWINKAIITNRDTLRGCISIYGQR